jgi:hypothetical protein
LGVDVLERALDFHRNLGLESDGVIGTEWVGDEENPSGAVALFQRDHHLTFPLSEVGPRQDARVP